MLNNHPSILIVEDNKDLLNLLKINLSDQGYQVHTSENLTSRLNHMKSVVSRFERGQINERIDVVGNDELSELSTCFNSMAETLVQNMEEIKNADKMRRCRPRRSF